MLTSAENYATDHNIKFSTNVDPKKSKTKGIIFSNSILKAEPAKLVLSGNDLPWIDGAKYLGNTVTNKIDGLQNDIKCKRAKYIEKNCELLQEFPFIHPEVMCKINSIYNSSFPGSVLWDFTSKNFKMIVNSWSVSVRHMWKVPLNTHRYFIEPLGGTHAKTMMYCRFTKFTQSILKSDKKAAIHLLYKTIDDKRTITGKNVNLILNEVNERELLKVNVNKLKKNMCFSEFPEDSLWKLNMIQELTQIRMGNLTLEFNEDTVLKQDEIEDILNYVTTC